MVPERKQGVEEHENHWAEHGDYAPNHKDIQSYTQPKVAEDERQLQSDYAEKIVTVEPLSSEKRRTGAGPFLNLNR